VVAHATAVVATRGAAEIAEIAEGVRVIRVTVEAVHEIAGAVRVIRVTVEAVHAIAGAGRVIRVTVEAVHEIAEGVRVIRVTVEAVHEIAGAGRVIRVTVEAVRGIAGAVRVIRVTVEAVHAIAGAVRAIPATAVADRATVAAHRVNAGAPITTRRLGPQGQPSGAGWHEWERLDSMTIRGTSKKPSTKVDAMTIGSKTMMRLVLVERLARQSARLAKRTGLGCAPKPRPQSGAPARERRAHQTPTEVHVSPVPGRGSDLANFPTRNAISSTCSAKPPVRVRGET